MFYSLRQTETGQQLLVIQRNSQLFRAAWVPGGQILLRTSNPLKHDFLFIRPLLTIWPPRPVPENQSLNWSEQYFSTQNELRPLGFYLWPLDSSSSKWKCRSRRVRLAPVSPVSVGLSLPACSGAQRPVDQRSGTVLQSRTGAHTLLCHVRRRPAFKWLISQTGFPWL